MTEYVLETRRATKAYGAVLALDHVSVHVKRGEIYGLIGDNGAGKTTLLKLLTGLTEPTAGEIRLFGGHGEKELVKSRKQTGAMVEQPGFFPGLSVEKNLEYYRLMKGIPGKEKVEEVLKMTGLWEKRGAKSRTLSLGMKQRLGLAIAMVGEPELLMLDEPINGLDPSGIVEFRKLLRRLNEEKNITILLSSHNLPELKQTADVFGFLSGGRLLEEISARTLKDRCADHLEIRVPDADVERYAALLEQNFPAESFQVMPDNAIRIFSPGCPPDAYSRAACENGILITGLEKRQYSLETYYMNLKKGGVCQC